MNTPTMSFKPHTYQQANARLHRQGQTKLVRIYHIIAEGTIDEDVMQSLDKKDTTQKALIEALRAKIGEVMHETDFRCMLR